MQKRSNAAYKMVYAPIPLDEDFPIRGEAPYEQGDSPITYLHLHDHLEIGYCFDGSGIFMVEDKVFSFQAGDVSVISPSEIHLASSAPGTVSHWSFMSLDPARLVPAQIAEQSFLRVERFAGRAFSNIIRPSTHPGLGELIKSIILELRGRQPGYKSVVRAKIWETMVQLHRVTRKSTPPTPPRPRHRAMDRIAPALAHIAGHYSTPLYIEPLAKLCHTSPAQFRRMMKAATGYSPQEYITHLRLQMASAQLLGSDKRILDIALESGFATLSSFNRDFKRQLGCSPRAWRSEGGYSSPVASPI